ncbi:hypothetical protein GOC19_33690, partial [Sinorhizobium meliloti]|nr:hypothetical protein [Sinorhizobium meliloti]
RRDLDEAKADLAAWLGKWSVRYPRLNGTGLPGFGRRAIWPQYGRGVSAGARVSAAS